MFFFVFSYPAEILYVRNNTALLRKLCFRDNDRPIVRGELFPGIEEMEAKWAKALGPDQP